MKPCVLSIGGSDSSCGAGIQADLKAFHELGCNGLTVVTAVVAESHQEVCSIHAIPKQIVTDQLNILFDTYPIVAIKTGMLYSEEIIEVVADCIKKQTTKKWFIIDPVLIASTGTSLCHLDIRDAYFKWLLPLADLITPNLDEFSILYGEKISSVQEMKKLGRKIYSSMNQSLLIKGGHFKCDPATDILFHQDQEFVYSSPFICDVDTHGTGCMLSAAIIALLAQNLPLHIAIQDAKKFLFEKLSQRKVSLPKCAE